MVQSTSIRVNIVAALQIQVNKFVLSKFFAYTWTFTSLSHFELQHFRVIELGLHTVVYQSIENAL